MLIISTFVIYHLDTKTMNEKLRQWIKHVESVRPEMDALADRLRQYGATVRPKKTNLVGELPYIAQFQLDDAITTITFLLKDHQTESDVVITNMTTLPPEKCRAGYGSQALQKLLRWAADNNLSEVRGTQVGSAESEQFCLKNGFEKCPEPNPCNDFVRKLNRPT